MDPGSWARTQNNLGNTVFSLGSLAGDPKRLEEATSRLSQPIEGPHPRRHARRLGEHAEQSRDHPYFGGIEIGMFLGVQRCPSQIQIIRRSSSAILPRLEAPQRFQVSLLPVFDEIAHTFLKASHGKVHTPLQSYLDGRVAIGGAYSTRRAILLAIHDMKENLEAPLALQKRALAELMSLKVRPAPQPQLYRDIATAILRMEVVIRSTARQAMKNDETKH